MTSSNIREQTSEKHWLSDDLSLHYWKWLPMNKRNLAILIRRGHSLRTGASNCSSSLQWSFCTDMIWSMDNSIKDQSVSEVMSFKNTSALCGDLRFIMSLPEMCDVKFLVGETREPVYGVKSIMATRSRVFYELLLDHQKKRAKEIESGKSTNSVSSKLKKIRDICTQRSPKPSPRNTRNSGQLIINLDGFEADVMRPIILYLHCGKVDLDILTVVGVMNAADVYAIEDLRSGCYQYAERLITVDTVLTLLTSTEKYSKYRWTKYLTEKILLFIREKAQDVFQQPDFVTLSKRTVIMLFTLDGLRITEEGKWDAALRWSCTYCHRREASHFRRNLKIFIRKIDFTKISMNMLQNVIRPLAVVPDHVITSAINYQRSRRYVIGQEHRSSHTPCKPPRKQQPASSLRKSGGSLLSSVSSRSSCSSESGFDSASSTSSEYCVWL